MSCDTRYMLMELFSVFIEKVVKISVTLKDVEKLVKEIGDLSELE